MIICAQRLIRRLCDCSEVRPIDPEHLEVLAPFRPDMKTCHQPVGCDLCDNTGFTGRFGCFELLINTKEMEQHIHRTQSAHELREFARSCGMRTLFEDALLKVSAGLTSFEEVLRAVVPE